ncbi:MAG TPA: deoxyribose-phosphate aldolase [Alphaproteobacteria bacterium]|nr:deoxyribose-phosphate aldolase [Alphaproteobacteria bacterium]
MPSETPLTLPPHLKELVENGRRAVASPEAARRALQLLDFTSLNDDDDDQRIEAFCRRAVTSVGHVAAVCLYPDFVPTARRVLAGTGVRVASVANFPAGGPDPATAADETRAAIDRGAEEVDIVFPYKAFLAGEADVGARVVAACRKACGPVPLKVFLETSQLPDADAVAALSRISIGEGADFIKTSTGKAGGGATLEAAAIMLDEIRNSGRTVGLKPSGGIRNTEQAAQFLSLAQAAMGAGYVAPATFRIGASSVMGDLLETLGIASEGAPTSSGY